MSEPRTDYRTFSAALMAAAALGGLAVGLTSPEPAMQIGAAAGAFAACLLGAVVVSGRWQGAFPGVVALGLVVAAVLTRHLLQGPTPILLRSLQVAAVLAYGGVSVAAVLRGLRVLGSGRAIALGFSTALALFVADALAPAPRPPQFTRWQVSGYADPQIGFRYEPNSTGANYYPDNPRGYFEATDPLAATWSVETHQGSQASLEPSTERGHVRVTIGKLTGDTIWLVKLKQAPFAIVGDRRYSLRLRARADAPRSIGCAVGQTAEPWKALSAYESFSLETDWRSFELPFVAPASEPKARIFCDLGSNAASVELADVRLTDESVARDLRPDAEAAEFFISYRFNALGFRGPDYDIPRPPNTFRILALGDSYTMGVGVRENDTFTVRLAERLNAAAAAGQPGRRYEVINTGVPGYSTREERLTYELVASQYDPQVVLLTMVFNDDMAFAEEVAAGHASPAPRPPGLSHLLRFVDGSQKSDRAYEYNKAMIEVLELNEAVRQRGARLAVAIFRASARFPPWLRLVETAEEALKGTEIPLIDLGPSLLEAVSDERQLQVHEVDGHPNEIAHRLAAEALERFLGTNGLLTSETRE